MRLGVRWVPAVTPEQSGRTPSSENGGSANGLRHGPDAECAACYECPGCGGADGSTPKRAEIRVSPGIARLICLDCEGAGVLCPNYDPEARDA